jgi:hypothetical protein
MRKLIIALCLIPLFGISQTKNVVTTSRYFPKNDKISEFENALTTHAQKYHTGDWSWRVYDILSGPDANGYMVSEGPNSWEQIDTRGTLGPEHMMDFNKNVASLTTGSSSMYATFRADLSTTQLTDFVDKIAITHVFPKPGMGLEVEKIILKAKKAWESGNQSVAVYEASASGAPQYIIVTRYKDGWKERDSSFRKSFMARYTAANGQDSFDSYLEGIQKCTESSWSELLMYNKELSSKRG